MSLGNCFTARTLHKESAAVNISKVPACQPLCFTRPCVKNDKHFAGEALQIERHVFDPIRRPKGKYRVFQKRSRRFAKSFGILAHTAVEASSSTPASSSNSIPINRYSSYSKLYTWSQTFLGVTAAIWYGQHLLGVSGLRAIIPSAELPEFASVLLLQILSKGYFVVCVIPCVLGALSVQALLLFSTLQLRNTQAKLGEVLGADAHRCFARTKVRVANLQRLSKRAWTAVANHLKGAAAYSIAASLAVLTCSTGCGVIVSLPSSTWRMAQAAFCIGGATMYLQHILAPISGQDERECEEDFLRHQHKGTFICRWMSDPYPAEGGINTDQSDKQLTNDAFASAVVTTAKEMGTRIEAVRVLLLDAGSAKTSRALCTAGVPPANILVPNKYTHVVHSLRHSPGVRAFASDVGTYLSRRSPGALPCFHAVYLDHCGSLVGRKQQLRDVFRNHVIANGGVLAVTFSTRCICFPTGPPTGSARWASASNSPAAMCSSVWGTRTFAMQSILAPWHRICVCGGWDD